MIRTTGNTSCREGLNLPQTSGDADTWLASHLTRRRLHGPKLVAVRLSAGFETWPPVVRSHKSRNAPVPYPTIHYIGTEMCTFPFQVDMGKVHYRICQLADRFQKPLTVPLHSLNGRQIAWREGCSRGPWKCLLHTRLSSLHVLLQFVYKNDPAI